MTSSIVYLGLGSNLKQPELQLQHALSALAQLPNSQLLDYSSLYSSTPIGVPGQPRYVNAVAKLKTDLAPLALLDQLQAIELNQGRIRDGERWGPRTLDLDILLIDQRSICSERLTVPHYQMHLRAFVLQPLLEISTPALCLPNGQQLAQLIQACPPDPDLHIIKSRTTLELPIL